MTDTLRGYRDPRLSPDGRQLAASVYSGDSWDVWLLELARGTLTRLTFDGANSRPVWSTGAERIFFFSDRGGIFSKLADGSGTAEQLTTGRRCVPTSLTSDGKTLLFRQTSEGTGYDIGMVHLEREREPEMLLQTSFNEHTGVLSPHDRWLAYVSDESGREEIYVRRFPGLEGKLQISTDGGTEPLWSRDGSELFYRNGEKMMVVAISMEPELFPGKPTFLFEGRYETGLWNETPGTNYDVTPDGQFVMIRPEESSGPTQINVVLNWHEELKRLVPVE